MFDIGNLLDMKEFWGLKICINNDRTPCIGRNSGRGVGIGEQPMFLSGNKTTETVMVRIVRRRYMWNEKPAKEFWPAAFMPGDCVAC